MEKLFGYDMVDGKVVINQTESEIVKFIYERNQYYHENPPQELIATVFSEHSEYDSAYTMEQAREDAKTDSRIIYYVIADANAKYGEYLKANARKERLALSRGATSKNGLCVCNGEVIIEPANYEKAQKIIKEGKAKAQDAR